MSNRTSLLNKYQIVQHTLRNNCGTETYGKQAAPIMTDLSREQPMTYGQTYAPSHAAKRQNNCTMVTEDILGCSINDHLNEFLGNRSSDIFHVLEP